VVEIGMSIYLVVIVKLRFFPSPSGDGNIIPKKKHS